MNPALSKIEHKTCFKCKYEADTAESVCPRCGNALQVGRNLRVRGGIAIAAGIFLIVFSGAIAAFLAFLLLSGTMQIPHSETAHITVVFGLTFFLLAFLVLFGIVGLINGIYMFKKGRKSIALIIVMALMIVVLIAICGAITTIVK